MNLRCLKLYRAYSTSFNSSNVGKFFVKLNFKELHQSSGNEKESCCLFFPSSTKREIWQFHVVVGAMTVEKRAKKRDALAKLLFCQSKPLAFLPFLLPSPSS